MIEEEAAVVDEDEEFEDVAGDAPPVDEYRLSTGPRVVSGGS